jgi:hypothetical protein
MFMDARSRDAIPEDDDPGNNEKKEDGVADGSRH